MRGRRFICKISYDDLRTGLTFADVREMLYIEQMIVKNRGEYMFVSRATVLGRWYQIKQEMWERIPVELRDVD